MSQPHDAPAGTADSAALLDDPRALLRHLYRVAVDRALPGKILASHLPPVPKGRTLVIGAGKGGGSMAQALEAAWPKDAPLTGLVITRYGHIPRTTDRSASNWSRPRIRYPMPPASRPPRG